MRRRIRSAGQALYDTGAYFYDGIREATTQIQYDTIQWEEAVVVDVITNDQHPEYSADGFNVGAIKFRFTNRDAYRTDAQLLWAWPLDPNISAYPLRNEIVLVILSEGNNVFFYDTRLNLRNRVTANPKFGVIAETKGKPPASERNKSIRGVDEGEAPPKEQNTADDEINRLGNTFQDRYDIFRLRHNEGDIILEGRSGHSIRFGSQVDAENPDNPQSPNILIRCGATNLQEILASPYALVSESFQNDDNSIWLVSNQSIPLQFATVAKESHFKSMEDPPTELLGSQIAMNSDRLIFNSKNENILVSSARGTHFSAGQDFTVDTAAEYRSYSSGSRTVQTDQFYQIITAEDYLLNVGKDQIIEITGSTAHNSTGTHSITAEKIFIGSRMDEEQPAVFGEKLRELLLAFVNAHLDNAATHTIPTIGIGPLNPNVVSALTDIKSQLESAKEAPFESQTVFISDVQE